jgi:hypothetical protein
MEAADQRSSQQEHEQQTCAREEKGKGGTVSLAATLFSCIALTIRLGIVGPHVSSRNVYAEERCEGKSEGKKVLPAGLIGLCLLFGFSQPGERHKGRSESGSAA